MAMCVINKEGKMPNPTRSAGQVSQAVRKGVKFVIGNEENGESKTVDNDVQFEIPPVEVGFLTKPR